MTGLVSTIRTATGADFFFDYSGTEMVTLGKDALETRLEGTKPLSVRVWDAGESHQIDSAGGKSRLDVIIEVAIKDSAQNLVERMADVMADLSLIIGRNPGLGGVSTTCRLAAVDPPFYQFGKAYATGRLHVRADYEYDPGVDR